LNRNAINKKTILALVFRSYFQYSGGERRFDEIHSRSNQDSIQWIVLEKYLYGRGSISLELFYYSLWAFFKALKAKFDVIYAPHGQIWDILAGYLISKVKNRPLVSVIHETPGIQPSKSFKFSKIKPKRNLRVILRRWFQGFLKIIYKPLLEKIDKILVYNPINELYLKKQGIKPQKILHGFMGTDFTIFRPMKLIKRYEACFSSRLVSYKGCDDLIYAWKQVVRDIPTAKLLILSPQPPPFYLNLIRKNNLESNIVFYKVKKTKQLIANALNASKLFVSPSYKEGFGLVVLEAMACGLPCVLYDNPTYKFFFKKSSLLVPVSDINLLADSILGLLKDEKLRSKLSKASLEYSRSFDWDRVAKNEIRILVSITEGWV